MADIYVKKQEIKLDNKVDFFNYHKVVFKFISVILGNAVFKYQLQDLLLSTNYFKDEKEFLDFLNNSENFGLLKIPKKNGVIGSQTVYVAKDYVIQNATKTKKSQYTYSVTDAKVSYYKMYYILEVVKSRVNHKQNFNELENILRNFTTLSVNKSQYLRLYQKLYNKNILNTNGEIMLNDLKIYEDYKVLNFDKKNKSSKKIDAIEKILKDEIYLEKVKSVHDTIVGNKNFWDYNLGKISDNKSYFMFFSQSRKDGYRQQQPGTIDIVKFDVSNNLGNAELADYITKVMESIKHHIKEEYKNINMYIYFGDEDTKKKVFGHSVNYKIARNGVKNLDSNLTARIKETSRRIYKTRLINFVNPQINFEKCTVSYRIYYKSQNTDKDDFYTLTLYLKNVNYENDIYGEEDKEKKRIEEEIKRKKKEVEKFANDEEKMSLLIEYLTEVKSKKGAI